MSQTHEHDEPLETTRDISEFDVLELAVRELAIQKGLFSHRDHRASRSAPRRSARPAAPRWWTRPGPTGAPRVTLAMCSW
jgi:thiocyanate hydrolase subunit gamma